MIDNEISRDSSRWAPSQVVRTLVRSICAIGQGAKRTIGRMFKLGPIGTSDLIQVGSLAIASIAIVFAGLEIRLQNKILRADLLKARFEMYWKNYEPISPALVKTFELYPEDYMKRDLYESTYKTNKRSIPRYILQSRTYEYLAFEYVLHHSMGIEDPLGQSWFDLWLTELLGSAEFLDAHANYGPYYPEFQGYIERLRESSRKAGQKK